MPVHTVNPTAGGSHPTFRPSTAAAPNITDMSSFPALPPSRNTLPDPRTLIPTVAALYDLDWTYPGKGEFAYGSTLLESEEAYRSRLSKSGSYALVVSKGNDNTSYSACLHANINGFAKFSELPIELRERVYELAILHSYDHSARCPSFWYTLDGRWYSNRSNYRYPAVCLATIEAMPVYRRMNPERRAGRGPMFSV